MHVTAALTTHTPGMHDLFASGDLLYAVSGVCQPSATHAHRALALLGRLIPIDGSWRSLRPDTHLSVGKLLWQRAACSHAKWQALLCGKAASGSTALQKPAKT